MSKRTKRKLNEYKRKREEKRYENYLTARQKKISSLQYIPLYFAAALVLLCGLMIFEAFRFAGHRCDFEWIGEGGVFAFNNITVAGMSMYWFFIFFGFACTFIISLLRYKKYGFSIVFALIIPAFFFIQSLYGAKGLFAFEQAVEARSFSHLNFSGQSLFGSLYFTLPLMPVVALITKKKITDVYDFVAPFWLLLLAFTRLGCFTSGCCHSKVFHIGGTVVLWPVQLFDSICALVLLWLCLRAETSTDRKFFVFRPFTILLIGYCFCRFILEFIRSNSPLFFKLTISQYHCIIFIIIGAVMVINDMKNSAASVGSDISEGSN